MIHIYIVLTIGINIIFGKNILLVRYLYLLK